LTPLLANLEPGTIDRAYLCGNGRMIMEAFEILVDKGLQEAHIHTETYF
jgi:ferredoxin-NADP reductase